MNKAMHLGKQYLFIAIYIGMLWLGLGNFLFAFEENALRHIEINPLNQNSVQLNLIFDRPMVAPNGFSIDSPASVVFDFPAVKNCLPKNMAHQSLNIGVLEGLNVVEGDSKVRLVMNVKSIVPFKAINQGNVISIILEADLLAHMSFHKDNSYFEGRYEINGIDFRRGAEDTGRVIIHLSTPNAVVNFREEEGKLIADFRGGFIDPRLLKRYDVTDFGTPIQNYIISQKGNSTFLTLETIGRYDKIAYQMDDQFIIEARYLSSIEATTDSRTISYTGERISLNFQDIELRAILQVIADFAGFNLITSDDVAGNITLRLQNVPWDQALDIILKSKNLDKRQNGNVVMIGPLEEIAKQELTDLNSKKQITELGPLRSELIPLNYAQAVEIQKLLREKGNSIMTSRGTVTIDPRTNTLLVQDIDIKIAEVKALIQKLDVPVRQVEISTQIITTDNTFEKTFGIRFGGGANLAVGQRRLGIGSTMSRARGIADYNHLNQFGPQVPPSNVDLAGSAPINSNVTRQALTAMSPGPTVNNTEGLFSDLGAILSPANSGFISNVGKIGFALARLPNNTLLDLELQALELESKAKTIARPKLITMDKIKASVEKGVQIPYPEASSSGATTISFKPAVLKLEVTPQITPDDRIFLDLNISNDTQGANLPISTTTGTAQIPIINSNKLQTQVLVDNGETIVLGGIFQITDQKRFQKVPFFGDLPIIGGLFRNYDLFYQPQELIIFITPKIVKPLHGC